MSEHIGAHTSVLLPSARVTLYVRDAELQASVKALATDWRFARVTFDIHEGDVESAISAYQGGAASPELLMVETLNIDDGFTSRLEVLAGSCGENTSAVVIGPVNDVYLYRKLIKMGVSDYLVRPLRTEVLAEVIAKTLIEKLGTTESRLIAFVGAKGGVGTSALAQATAWGVSDRLSQKTIILDAAGGWSYLSVGLGSEPITTLAEASRAAGNIEQDSFRRMIAAASDKLSVLATGIDMMLDEVTTPEALESIINHLMITYPVVIVDLSGANATVKRMVMHKAHEVMIVTTPALSSLRSARSLLQEIKEVRGGSDKEIELIINMKDQSAGFEVSANDIATSMARKPSLTIPFTPKIFAVAETQGKKITGIPGAEEIISGLMSLVRKVVTVADNQEALEKSDNSLIGGLLGKLKAK